jgi:hypothetical protein
MEGSKADDVRPCKHGQDLLALGRFWRILNRSIRDWYTQLAVAKSGSMAIFETTSVTAGSW